MNKNISTNESKYEFNFKLMSKPNIYWVTLKRGKKELEIRDFTFGMSQPNIEDVLCHIGREYRLYTDSPTLESYMLERGCITDIEDDYEILKQYIREYRDFFEEEELEKLMYWEDSSEEILVADEICSFIRALYNDADMSIKQCAEHRESHCSVWSSFEELQEYMNQDDDNVSVEDLKTSTNIIELSNGLIFYIS